MAPGRRIRCRSARLEVGMAWILWLIAAAGLGVAEFFTLAFGFGLIAAAAVVAAATAALGAPLLIQVLAFALASAAGLLVVRPIALRHMTQPSLTREGSDALIGRQAVVMKDVTGSDGLIKVSGEVWSARAFDETLVIPQGAQVDVMEIQGATAIVYPRELLP
ncbi:NfeD family protein [Kribbella sp. CA-253562]|uniref:NfeD family protein n=1 Tax=Kribbella sp. CA-253562 TaxID=3239942 RepID=UPI003D8D1886